MPPGGRSMRATYWGVEAEELDDIVHSFAKMVEKVIG
jgi:hypothetical protein